MIVGDEPEPLRYEKLKDKKYSYEIKITILYKYINEKWLLSK